MRASSAKSLSVYRIAHHERWLGRIEHDDRLASCRAADRFDRARRRLGELVDVGTRARSRAPARDRCDDLAVVDVGDLRHRRDHGDRRLSAARHHVDVGCIQMPRAVDHRNAVRTDRRRRQVDHADAGPDRAQERIVVRVGRCRRRIEHDVDVGKRGHPRGPSTPSCVVATPIRAARPSPSDAASIPTIAPISICSPCRRILIIRSVPMLPLPMMPTLSFLLIERLL